MGVIAAFSVGVRSALAATATLSIEPSTANEFVIDHAQLIGEDSHTRLDGLLLALLRDADIELRAVSLQSLDGASIDTVTQKLFERWRIGSRTRANRGVLFVLAAGEQRVRCEISYGLEGIFPDAFVSYVEHKQLVPYFEHGRVGEGFEATIELIAGRAFQQVLGRNYDPLASGAGTIDGYHGGGGGAQTAVPLAPAALPLQQTVGTSSRESFGAQATPIEAWERFLEVNRRHIKDPEIGLYDDAAKGLMRGVSTDAGQDQITQRYSGQAYTVRQQGDRAAIVFRDDPNNLLAPWFFRRTSAGWQLDGSMYPEVIGYNHMNQWFFKRRDHPYRFAFSDYRFDQHGFAFPRAEGSASRTYLGASFYWSGYQGQGVLVMAVEQDSPAEHAGLEVGDIILRYDRQPIDQPATLVRLIRKGAPGQMVELDVIRGSMSEPTSFRLDDGTLQEVRPVTYGLRPPNRLTVQAVLGSE